MGRFIGPSGAPIVRSPDQSPIPANPEVWITVETSLLRRRLLSRRVGV